MRIALFLCLIFTSYNVLCSDFQVKQTDLDPELKNWLHNKIEHLSIPNEGAPKLSNSDVLGFLIGNWSAKLTSSSIYSNYYFNEEKKCLIFGFKEYPEKIKDAESLLKNIIALFKNGKVSEGIEVIYCNENNEICSSCNNSGTESPEELWMKENNSWVLTKKEGNTEYKVVYTPQDKDSFTWEYKQKINGDFVTAIGPVLNQRIPF